MKQEIIEAIAKDFSSGCRKSKKLVSLYKKMVAGKATYLDADQYALETAQVLGSTLHKHLGVETISGAEYKEIISSVLPEGLHGIHDSVATYAQTIQNGINKRAGLGFQAVKAQFEPEKAREIVTKAVSVETFTEAEGAVKVDTMNFAQNAATKTMKDNAQLSEDLGYEVTVDRTYDDVGVHDRKEPCQWCLEREGHWTYAEALSNGVFERHPGCGCEIIYKTSDKVQRQTDWTRNQWADM